MKYLLLLFCYTDKCEAQGEVSLRASSWRSQDSNPNLLDPEPFPVATEVK